MFTLTINTDSAAFEGDDLVPELVRLLDKLATRVAVGSLEAGEDQGAIIDANGNSVGQWTYKE
jgi:hypothetical protein